MTKSLNILAAALSVAGLMIASNGANATSLAVQLACASDYYSYCSKHDTTGPGVRACMRANGERLSTRCVNALVSAGEVSKAEVDRRAAAARAASR